MITGTFSGYQVGDVVGGLIRGAGNVLRSVCCFCGSNKLFAGPANTN